jgi:hypothetical protein
MPLELVNNNGNGKGKKKVTRHTLGTLAHAFHQMSLPNESVYAFLQHLEDTDPRITALLADYDAQTDKEKENIAIWDKLCRTHKIPVGKLYGKLCESILYHSRNLGFSQLAADTPAVLKSLGAAAKKQKNLDHMRLFLETSGTIGKNGSAININLQQNVDNRSINVGLPQLDDTLKGSSRKIREANELLLTQGNTEYIDTTASVVDEREKVKVEHQTPTS